MPWQAVTPLQAAYDMTFYLGLVGAMLSLSLPAGKLFRGSQSKAMQQPGSMWFMGSSLESLEQGGDAPNSLRVRVAGRTPVASDSVASCGSGTCSSRSGSASRYQARDM